jgi:hypothetical protein
VGVQTVDSRTGQRVALWRTLAVALVQVATRLLVRRLMARPGLLAEDERRRQASELQAIKERSTDDEGARNAELMRHYAAHSVNPTANLWLPLAAGLGSTLVNRTVRRRLAPTLVILRGRA